jgi:hypothetical protein
MRTIKQFGLWQFAIISKLSAYILSLLLWRIATTGIIFHFSNCSKTQDATTTYGMRQARFRAARFAIELALALRRQTAEQIRTRHS